MRERASAGLLAILVGASVLLSARLWASGPPLPASLPPSTRYVASGTLAGLRVADLAQPWRMLLHFGSARSAALADPGQAQFAATWAQARAVLGALPAAAWASGRAVAQAACASLAAHAPVSIEIDMGQRQPWAVWASLWGLPAPSGPAPAVGRLLIVPAAKAATICAPTAAGAVELHVATGASEPLAAGLAALHTQPLDYELQPLSAPAGLSVRPGIYVPQPGFSRGAVTVQPEHLDAAGLAAALFPSTATVRHSRGLDGAALFTDGAAQLRVGAAGNADFAAGLTAGADAGAASAALASAVAFVDRVGGWPPTATLFGLRAIAQPGAAAARAGRASVLGYDLAFTERWRGLPLLADPAPLQVEVGAPGVLDYARQVDVPVTEGRPVTWLPASRALATLLGGWPVAAANSPHIIEDVYPAYLRAGSGQHWLPVWGVELADGSLVALSATSGEILAVVRPQG